METPLQVLSRAATMVDNSNGKLSSQHSIIRNHHNYYQISKPSAIEIFSLLLPYEPVCDQTAFHASLYFISNSPGHHFSSCGIIFTKVINKVLIFLARVLFCFKDVSFRHSMKNVQPDSNDIDIKNKNSNLIHKIASKRNVYVLVTSEMEFNHSI